MLAVMLRCYKRYISCRLSFHREAISGLFVGAALFFFMMIDLGRFRGGERSRRCVVIDWGFNNLDDLLKSF